MEAPLNTNLIRSIALIFLSCIFHSCCALKNYNYTVRECQNIPRESVDASIYDYHRHFIKRQNVDSAAVKVLVWDTSTDWYLIFMIPWEIGSDAEKFSVDRLSKHVNQIPPLSIPTEYVEKDNVLYTWHNPEKKLTEDMIAILSKYHLLLNAGEDEIVITGEGGLYYIFCESKPEKFYKRVSRDWGTPLPKCNCH